MSERNEDQRQNVCRNKGFISNNVMEWSKHINNLLNKERWRKQ